jgi:hypothetical protein
MLRFTVVTLLLHHCYTVVTPFITLLLHNCYTIVTPSVTSRRCANAKSFPEGVMYVPDVL